MTTCEVQAVHERPLRIFQQMGCPALLNPLRQVTAV
jgi:hypothetical protein